MTRSVKRRAISTVRSRLSESTTMISSAHARDSRARAMLASSLRVMTMAVIFIHRPALPPQIPQAPSGLFAKSHARHAVAGAQLFDYVEAIGDATEDGVLHIEKRRRPQRDVELA